MTDKSVYVVPEGIPISKLECAEAFSLLTPKEKLYAHYISQASWAGSRIVLRQVSAESESIFHSLLLSFSTPISALRTKSGISEEEFEHVLDYAIQFFGNMGNYLSFGDTKFVPNCSKESFRKVIEASGNAEAIKHYDSIEEKLFSLNDDELSLGLKSENGVSTYYSEGIEKSEIAMIQDVIEHEEDMSAYNTRLFKTGDKQYQVKLASVDSGEYNTKWRTSAIQFKYGDYSDLLVKVVANLKKAIEYSANDDQKQMLQEYLNHFQNGNISHHKQAQRHWIADIGPTVETNMGFVESYRDPYGVRGEFESFVAVVDKKMSMKFGKLVAAAPRLLPLLPWPSSFEKDSFKKPDFTSLSVISFVTSGIPAGINIPNYDDIRQNEGFKNVSLGNVLSARSPSKTVTFLNDEDAKLFEQYVGKAFEVQVGLHELLGHGSGKLLTSTGYKKYNFDIDNVTNPFTGDKISTYYKQGQTYDSVFLSMGSPMEECRAECVGVYLCSNASVLNIFGYEDAKDDECHDITYVNWVNMARAGLMALQYYTPEAKKWRQAHMQARFAILRVLLEQGAGVVSLSSDSADVTLSIDRSKILGPGTKAIGEFLGKLNVYKATADIENATKLFGGMTTVDDKFLELRKIVIAKRQPRKVFVQVTTELTEDGKDVTLKDYEPTKEGMIQSFVDKASICAPTL